MKRKIQHTKTYEIQQSLKRKVHTNKHIKNQERPQVNNLTLETRKRKTDQS